MATLPARQCLMSTQVLLTLFGALSAATLLVWVWRLAGTGQSQN